jgi:integrating conjugative element protein (TIGR03755 family)
MINNSLLGAHKAIELSTKSCQEVKNQISQGQNPYQDWASISVGNQWKQHLSLTGSGTEDINDAKKDVDQNAGNAGVPWVQGNKGSDGKTTYAGGLNQPPVHVISDTVKAGYNAMLTRDLGSNDPAPNGGELGKEFHAPSDAVAWVINVVGDQTITTCNDPSCTAPQGGISGRGLMPWVTACGGSNQAYCADTVATNIGSLVSGQTPMTKDNLQAVSAGGLVISPQVITSIRSMEASQRGIVVAKLAQEVATQHVINRALMARTMLQTGSQVPVIASNKPALTIINQATQHIDKDLQAMAFESQVRKQMMSNTVSDVLNYSGAQQQNAAQLPAVAPKAPLMQNSALPVAGASK